MTEIRLIAYLLAFAGVLGGGAWIVHAHDNRVRAAQQAGYAQAALEATTKARAEEQRRVAAQAEINDETQRLATRARSDGVRVDAAATGLRSAFVASLRPGTGNPFAVSVLTATPAESDVRADVFGELAARAGAYALEADLRGASGAGCVAEYRSLIPGH